MAAEDFVVYPSVISRKSVTCDCVPAVDAYVRRSTLCFEIRVLNELGEQVKDDCGGRAYDVINLDEDI